MRNFILNSDLLRIVTNEDLNVISNSSQKTIDSCNAMAIDEAAAYLCTKYDVEALFKDPILYSTGSTYNIGDRIYIRDESITGTTEYKHYSCIASGATSGTPITDTTYFKLGDTRDYKLLQVVMSISLFYLHFSLTPNNIPDFRIIAYDGNGNKDIMSALKWLGLIKSGEISPYGWDIISTSEEVVDPEVGEEFDKLGNNPAEGIMWGNDLGNEYFWYNNGYDKNIINK